MRAYWADLEAKLQRTFGVAKKTTACAIVLDALSWSFGGVIASLRSGTQLQYFFYALKLLDTDRFQQAVVRLMVNRVGNQ